MKSTETLFSFLPPAHVAHVRRNFWEIVTVPETTRTMCIGITRVTHHGEQFRRDNQCRLLN